LPIWTTTDLDSNSVFSLRTMEIGDANAMYHFVIDKGKYTAFCIKCKTKCRIEETQ